MPVLSVFIYVDVYFFERIKGLSLMTKESQQPFARRLRDERLHYRWSQQELADHLGTTPVTISRWENGVSKPSPYFRLKLGQIFKKSFDEIVGEPDAESSYEPQVDVSEQDPLLLKTADEDISTAMPPLPENEREQTLVTESTLHSPQKRLFSRRTMVVSLLSGVAAVSLGGAWWMETSFHQTSSPLVSSSPARMVYRYSPGNLIPVNYVTWSPYGNFIACANGNKTAQVLEATTGAVKMVYRSHTGFVNCVTWAPDEARVASASADKTVQIWKTTTGEKALTYSEHRASVYVVSWSHNGRLLASGGADKTVQVWDAFSGKRVQIYTDHTLPVWNIEWSPDDERIASGGEDGIIRIWNPTTAHASQTFVYEGPHSRINEISWSSNGKQIASAHIDGTVRLWDARTGRAIFTYNGHTTSVITARWSPNGRCIASGDLDGSIHVWDAHTGRNRIVYKKQINEIYEVSWSPDGKRLASASADATMYVCTFDF